MKSCGKIFFSTIIELTTVEFIMMIERSSKHLSVIIISLSIVIIHRFINSIQSMNSYYVLPWCFILINHFHIIAFLYSLTGRDMNCRKPRQIEFWTLLSVLLVVIAIATEAFIAFPAIGAAPTSATPTAHCSGSQWWITGDDGDQATGYQTSGVNGNTPSCSSGGNGGRGGGTQWQRPVFLAFSNHQSAYSPGGGGGCGRGALLPSQNQYINPGIRNLLSSSPTFHKTPGKYASGNETTNSWIMGIWLISNSWILWWV